VVKIKEWDGKEGGWWLEKNIQRKLGKGVSIHFWSEKWVSEVSLRDSFGRLFLISNDKNARIKDMGEWRGGRWEWRLSWRRDLFQWERDLAQVLLQIINGQQLNNDVEDTWWWTKDSSGVYTVKSAYLTLIGNQPHQQQHLFNKIWSNLVPPKVAALCWRICLDRVPTKLNLVKRKCLPVGTSSNCVFCNCQTESTQHLFFACDFVYARWVECYNWLNFMQPLPITFSQHINQHHFKGMSKKGITYSRVIWFAMIWEIWCLRNNIIFKNDHTARRDFLDRVKYNSWIWITTLAGDFIKSFPEWQMNPLVCLTYAT